MGGEKRKYAAMVRIDESVLDDAKRAAELGEQSLSAFATQALREASRKRLRQAEKDGRSIPTINKDDEQTN